jgi:hypothetical protein
MTDSSVRKGAARYEMEQRIEKEFMLEVDL